jgi:uncharacterized alkaline shock family protein YloU
MNIFFRILLALYAFCMTMLSLLSMAVTFKTEMFDSISGYISEAVLQNPNSRFAMLLIAFVFFCLSITFLLSGFKTNKDKKAVSKHTNIGEIKISLNSIENIALTASRKLIGVRDTKADVIKLEDGVAIAIRTVVLPEINIPALSEDIQVKVKSAVEESAGIKVNDIKVIVENIHTGYKSRVE